MEQEVLEIVREIQRGDDTRFSILCEKYKPLILSLVDKIFGGNVVSYSLDRDDLVQEANIALFRAAGAFDTTRGEITFGLYAKICVRNRLVTIKRKAVSEKKKQALHIADKVAASKNTGRVHMSEESAEMVKDISEVAERVLSPYEKQVFALYAEELSYKEIAERVGKDEKSVDNAIYRIKSKLKKNI